MNAKRLNEAYAACNVLIDFLIDGPRTAETCRRLDDLNSLRSEILDAAPTGGEPTETEAPR